MPMRRDRRGDQFTSRQAGSVVLSIGAVVLMIICLVVVIVVWATQSRTHSVPEFDAEDKREQLPAVLEQLSSYNYLDLDPEHSEPQATHTIEVAPQEDDHDSEESDDVNVSEKLHCSVYKDDIGLEEDANCTVSGTMCNCTSLLLTKIPNRLAERAQCTTLLLGDNCLREIPAYAFAEFTDLEHLDLRNNQIDVLYLQSFQGLTRLRSLILGHNILPMNSFTPGIFQNMSSLTYLDISGNNDNLASVNIWYPGEALSDLQNLQELSIDGLYNQGFPSNFEVLTSLNTLNLGGPYTGYCYLGLIRSDTFLYLPYLKTLNISNCCLTEIVFDVPTINGLGNLVTLDISWNEKFGVANVRHLLGYLPHLQHLYANHVTLSYASSTSIKTTDVENLPSGLRLLEAQGNGFESVEAGVFEILPENLTYIDVSDNRFLFGAYLANMSSMTNLEFLVLNGANVVYKIPKSYPSSKLSEYSTNSSESHGTESEKLVFQLPPNLRRLSMIKAGLSYRLDEMYVNPDNSLEELNLDENVFSRLIGPLNGLHTLRNLSMARCNIEYVEKKFFRNLTSLERLDLSGNFIGVYLPAHGNISAFQDLVHLKYLNLAFNFFQEMDAARDFLKGLNNLEELYMQRNRLSSFKMNISNLHKLRILNLSRNFLSSLDSEVTKFIHRLVIQFNTSIQVDLSGNFFTCDCSNIDFLRWMSRSKAVNKSLFSDTDRYFCADSDLKVFTTIKDGYLSVVNELSRECTPKYGLFLFSLFGTLILMSFALGLILYRFRWNLRYLYYAAYLSVKKGGRPVVIEEDYPYDVFLSYARPDEQFIVDTLCPALETRGLKLHVHGRDFVAGDYIASNIVTAVKESRKTLVVLTLALLESTWCNYEIQMANMESVHTGRPVLIFLIKESVSNRQLGQNLLSHIRNNTYIPYPESGPAQEPGNHLLEAFWDKLAADLKS